MTRPVSSVLKVETLECGNCILLVEKNRGFLLVNLRNNFHKFLAKRMDGPSSVVTEVPFHPQQQRERCGIRVLASVLQTSSRRARQ